MRNQYYHAHIDRIIEHRANVRSFIFDTGELNLDSSPGQFVMVWLPGVGEKPFSLSNSFRIAVKNVGPFTEKLFEKKGGYLDIRGPYGRGFPNIGKNTAIGGGVGIAPLMHLLYLGNLATGFVLAGKTKEDLIFLEDIVRRFEGNYVTDYSSKNVVCVTEDGSYGIKGIATDASIPKADHNYYVCGPEGMMEGVAEKLVNEGVGSERIYLSLERYMKCGAGICGSCSFSGYRVCADGPVFRYDKIKDLPHFNEWKRSRTGELVEI